MSDPLVFVDSSEIREGKLEELTMALKELAEFVETNEPRPISYSVYLSEDGTRMTVVQVHPDSASMELHMEVAGPEFAKFKDLITMRTMDVYGRPSDKLLRLMQQKAEMLGSAAVGVHELAAGFTRLATR